MGDSRNQTRAQSLSAGSTLTTLQPRGLLSKPVFSPSAKVGTHRSTPAPNRLTGCWACPAATHRSLHLQAGENGVMQSKTVRPTTALSPRKKARTIRSEDVSVLDADSECCGPLDLVWQCDHWLLLTPMHFWWVASGCMKCPGEQAAGHSSNLDDLSGAPWSADHRNPSLSSPTASAMGRGPGPAEQRAFN